MTRRWYWKHLFVKKWDSSLSPCPSNFAGLILLKTRYDYVTDHKTLNQLSHQNNWDATRNNAVIHCISYPLTTISIILLYNGISSQSNGATFISFYSLNGHSIRKFLCNIHDGIICITWHDLTLDIKRKVSQCSGLHHRYFIIYSFFWLWRGLTYLIVFLSFKS